MIAILPSAGEPDEDNLNREGDNGGDSVAEKRIRSHVERLNRESPIHARRLKLLGTAFCNMADAHVHGDRHGFEEACDEALDALHEIIVANKRGLK
jgi:hypothetical protein